MSDRGFWFQGRRSDISLEGRGRNNPAQGNALGGLTAPASEFRPFRPVAHGIPPFGLLPLGVSPPPAGRRNRGPWPSADRWRASGTARPGADDLIQTRRVRLHVPDWGIVGALPSVPGSVATDSASRSASSRGSLALRCWVRRQPDIGQKNQRPPPSARTAGRVPSGKTAADRTQSERAGRMRAGPDRLGRGCIWRSVLR
jgi:hypothetical protein